LTDEEFARAKQTIIEGNTTPPVETCSPAETSTGDDSFVSQAVRPSTSGEPVRVHSKWLGFLAAVTVILILPAIVYYSCGSPVLESNDPMPICYTSIYHWGRGLVLLVWSFIP